VSTHQTGFARSHRCGPPFHTTALQLLSTANRSVRWATVPNASWLLLDQAAQLATAESVASLGSLNWEGPPVRIHPEAPGRPGVPCMGGPDPESSLLNPSFVSYSSAETSRSSNLEAMGNPRAHASTAWLP